MKIEKSFVFAGPLQGRFWAFQVSLGVPYASIRLFHHASHYSCQQVPVQFWAPRVGLGCRVGCWRRPFCSDSWNAGQGFLCRFYTYIYMYMYIYIYTTTLFGDCSGVRAASLFRATDSMKLRPWTWLQKGLPTLRCDGSVRFQACKPIKKHRMKDDSS